EIGAEPRGAMEIQARRLEIAKAHEAASHHGVGAGQVGLERLAKAARGALVKALEDLKLFEGRVGAVGIGKLVDFGFVEGGQGRAGIRIVAVEAKTGLQVAYGQRQ